ncbi:hypothetical protein CEE45_16890 [Candidatus Heimdallarchaeota archaeon B3_Heim]|nr:MAG: hypothetical protein CEE45_16890 [Candidatus Heimdallarchaeota archaeon B3_Heim]
MKVSISFILLILISFFSNVWLSQDLLAQEIKGKVPAEKILKMIEKGEPVEIDNAIITGELKLSKINLEVEEINGKEMRVVKSKVTITNSTIQEIAIFRYYIPETDRYSPILLTQEVSFYLTEFQKRADFSEAQFQKEADFSYAQFQKRAIFSEAQFQEEPNFRRAQFQEEAFFETAQFQEGANFYEAKFRKLAYFEGAQFQEGAFFMDAQFEYLVDFGDTDFPGLFIDWRQIKGRLVWDETFYAQLIKHYKESGEFGDADSAYYEYRVRERRIEKRWYNPTRGLEYIFLDLSCGYGVKPFRAVLYGLVLIFLFSCFYYQPKAVKERGKPDSKPRFTDAFYFSVNTFTTVGYGDWYPTAQFLKIKGRKICRFRTLAMIEGFVGWLIIALFLVTLGKVWIR